MTPPIHDRQLMIPRVAALVVTYHPDPGFPERLEKLLSQVERIVIVDNGSNVSTLAWIKTYEQRAGVTILQNSENLGIAAALNQGMQLLADEACEWVFTSDQDSTVSEGCVAALLATATADPTPARVAVVGSDRKEANSSAAKHRWLRPRKLPPFFERVTCDQIGVDGVTLVITSGSLTSVGAFRRLGPFREDYFIDLVDFEYCLRARVAGYKILVSCQAQILHSVGSRTRKRIAGISFSPTHHGPRRKYYLFRNSVDVMRAYGWKCPHWLIYQLSAMIEIALGILLMEDRKCRKFNACLVGLWDGVLGRMGATGREF